MILSQKNSIVHAPRSHILHQTTVRQVPLLISKFYIFLHIGVSCSHSFPFSRPLKHLLLVISPQLGKICIIFIVSPSRLYILNNWTIIRPSYLIFVPRTHHNLLKSRRTPNLFLLPSIIFMSISKDMVHSLRNTIRNIFWRNSSVQIFLTFIRFQLVFIYVDIYLITAHYILIIKFVCYSFIHRF